MKAESVSPLALKLVFTGLIVVCVCLAAAGAVFATTASIGRRPVDLCITTPAE